MNGSEFERFVFIDLPGENKPVPAGLFTLDHESGVGRFRYGNRYLERPNAMALDPVNLPLSPQEFVTRKNKGIFGPLCDLLPDSWGRFILARARNVPFGTLKEHELLDLASTQAVGALSLGTTPERPATPGEEPVTLAELGEVADAFDRAMNEEPLSPAIRYLLRQGTSLGGAQPKCPVRIDGEEWIAKFESTKTLVRYPAVEFAAMTLAGKAGITIPEIRLEPVSGRTAYLVKRFDRGRGFRIPFLSAFALGNLDINELEQASYPDIAGRMRRFVAHVRRDHHELFRRIAFNMHIRNEDDHPRNHGFLHLDGWSLAPAFDLLPMPARKQEAETFHLSLQVGAHGSAATLDNLLSRHEAFSLKRGEALDIIREVRGALTGWEGILRRSGARERDIESVRWSFEGFRTRYPDIPKK
ncbi:MAG: type II toxin-antitoxin system HipA family toxin [Desulfobulbaceae bacterium]|jgi:serine/threonine-protein kinase HipA|nr:type II toxin-antitoxin system HipA family toxin [Desulfobulbaceae bacterium]MDY0352339.1 type II toxin-antitoxin system HipA family toxin [Desulfobulbaceae bacterium]